MMEYDPRDWYWAVAGDQSQVYSSRRASLVAIADPEYQAFLQRAVATQIASMDDLTDVLRANNVPPFHRVAKSTIISRLTDAQLEAAISAMTARQQERWRAPDQPAVNADDPDALALLTVIGADPATVLAPE